MIPSPAIYNFQRSQIERWIDETVAMVDRFDAEPEDGDEDQGDEIIELDWISEGAYA